MDIEPDDGIRMLSRAEFIRRSIGDVEVPWDRPSPKFDALSYIAGGIATFALTVTACAFLPDLVQQPAMEAYDYLQDSFRESALRAPIEKITRALD